MKETNITYCAVCNSRVERIMHQFPSRKPPHNLPYFAALYHRDPFWKKVILKNIAARYVQQRRL